MELAPVFCCQRALWGGLPDCDARLCRWQRRSRDKNGQFWDKLGIAESWACTRLGSPIGRIHGSAGRTRRWIRWPDLRTIDGHKWDGYKKQVIVSHLAAVHFHNRSRGYAIGERPNVYATQNDGENWEVFQQNSGWDMLDVHFPTPNIGYAVGFRGKILRSDDIGRSWASQVSGINEMLNSVWFLSADEGFAVGGSRGGTGIILATTNAGATWTSQSSPQALFDVRFLTLEFGYAVGDAGAFLVTSDRGQTWREVAEFGALTHTHADVWHLVGDSGLTLRTTDSAA